MTWAISPIRAISSSAVPSGRFAISLCSASSWRSVPTRQGTHWPQDSSRKKAPTRVALDRKQHLWPTLIEGLPRFEIVSGKVKRVGLEHLWTRT